MKPLTASVAAFAALWSCAAAACPVCWGDSGDRAVKAANAGVGFMLGLTVVMLAAFGSLFLYFRHRARLVAVHVSHESHESPEGGFAS